MSLVPDERQGPAGKNQRRFLLVVLENDERRSQIPGRAGARGCAFLGCGQRKNGLGLRPDDGSVKGLDDEGTDEKGGDAVKCFHYPRYNFFCLCLLFCFLFVSSSLPLCFCCL